MQKRSHRLLARTLLSSCDGFSKRRFETAFLFGSFQPDCNPLSYLKGAEEGTALRGHNFSNSRAYIDRSVRALQSRERWTVWQYYTLGKLTHYLADAFTYPHNETYTESLAAHHRYETALRAELAVRLGRQTLPDCRRCEDLTAEIDSLHRRYLGAASDHGRDIRYILEATGILMASLAPAGALGRAFA